MLCFELRHALMKIIFHEERVPVPSEAALFLSEWPKPRHASFLLPKKTQKGAEAVGQP